MADSTTFGQQKRVQVYKEGLCVASVCAVIDAAPDEVERATNAEVPTGISSRWQVAGEPFADGSPNPCPCNSEPDARRHWLLEC